jgi:hypothetical protein
MPRRRAVSIILASSLLAFHLMSLKSKFEMKIINFISVLQFATRQDLGRLAILGITRIMNRAHTIVTVTTVAILTITIHQTSLTSSKTFPFMLKMDISMRSTTVTKGVIILKNPKDLLTVLVMLVLHSSALVN